MAHIKNPDGVRNMKHRLLFFIMAIVFATVQTFAQSTVNYEYDANNRLKKVTYSSGATISYTYDELGNRLSKKVTGSAPNPNIHFYDSKVKAICIENWDVNGDSELSYDEAAAVTDLGQVFKDNGELMSFEELKFFTGLTALCNEAFTNCHTLSSVYIPDGVTSIGDFCFASCNKLKTIRIPNGLKSIGSYVFEYCAFTSIHIPASVSSIGGYLFGSCKDLESITVDEANETYDSRNNCNAIIETATNKLVAGCRNTIMPDNLKAIGDGAFYNNLSVYSNALTIPKGVTSIGDRAFTYNSINEITFPENLDFVGWEAFYETGWFRNQPDGMVYINNIACQFKGSMPTDASFEFNEDTKMISPSLFYYSAAKNVISVSIPKSVRYIGYLAFDYFYNLKSITVYTKMPPKLDNVYRTFPKTLDNVTLYVPYGSKTIYENTVEWQRFKNIVEMEPLPYVVGDANNDGIVTNADAVAITNYIFGNPPANFDSIAADVNGDDKVNITDVVAVINIVLNNNNPAPAREVILKEDIEQEW